MLLRVYASRALRVAAAALLVVVAVTVAMQIPSPSQSVARLLQTHCGDTLRPFDLVPESIGPNQEFVNPMFAWQCSYSGSTVDYPAPSSLCNDFRSHHSGDPSSGLDLGSSPCTSQITGIDYASLRTLGIPAIYWVACHWPENFADATLSGHANYGLVTYSGTIHWGDHNPGFWTGGDDDYSMFLEPPVSEAGKPDATVRGVTKDLPEGHRALQLEFKASETINQFHQSWWTNFRRTVDRSKDAVAAIIDGHDAVAIGLFGLDVRHQAHSEVHPVFALAIREDVALDRAVQSDRWAIFVRNSGNEGGCAQFDHLLPGSQLILHLPPPRGLTGPAVLVNSEFDSNTVPRVRGPRDQPSPSHAVLAFTMPNPDDHPFADGEVVLHWQPGQS